MVTCLLALEHAVYSTCECLQELAAAVRVCVRARNAIYINTQSAQTEYISTLIDYQH